MELSLEKPENIAKVYDETSGLWKFVRVNNESADSIRVIERTLNRLGLSKNEVKVYLCLARTGMHKASEISEALSLHRTETYRILRDLEKRGLISSVFEKPLKFIATPFENAITLLIDAKKMKISLLEKKKESLVGLWLSLPQLEIEPERKEVFQILEGEEQISLRADELLSDSKKEVQILVSDQDIASFYHSGVLEKLEKTSGRNVKVRLLTSYSPKTCFFLDKAKLKDTKYSVLETHDELPTYLIGDEDQLLLIIRTGNERAEVAALWTNYGAFMKALRTLFHELWNHNS